MTCSLREAAKITGLSYEYLLACSIADALIKRLFREDKINEDHQKAIKRLIRAEKQKSRSKEQPASCAEKPE